MAISVVFQHHLGMRHSLKNHKSVVRVKFRFLILSIIHTVSNLSQANNVSSITFKNPTSVSAIQTYVMTVEGALLCQKIWDVTYKHCHVEKDQLRHDCSLANVERPTLERTISFVISTSPLGGREMIYTLQFRLAYANEMAPTKRMVFGIRHSGQVLLLARQEIVWLILFQAEDWKTSTIPPGAITGHHSRPWVPSIPLFHLCLCLFHELVWSIQTSSWDKYKISNFAVRLGGTLCWKEILDLKIGRIPACQIYWNGHGSYLEGAEEDHLVGWRW